MPTSTTTVLTSALLAMLLLSPAAQNSHAAIDPQTPASLNDLLQGKGSTREPRQTYARWYIEDGYAHVNLYNGHVQFEVKKLPMAGSTDTEFGREDEAARVKGTLICLASAGHDATLIDTPSVPVVGKGEASYSGYLSLPVECLAAPNDIVFLIRIAEAEFDTL